MTINRGTVRTSLFDIGTVQAYEDSPTLDAPPTVAVGTLIDINGTAESYSADMAAVLPISDETAATAVAFRDFIAGSGAMNGNFACVYTVDSPNAAMQFMGGGSILSGFSLSGGTESFFRLGGSYLDPVTESPWADESAAQMRWPLAGTFSRFLAIIPFEFLVGYPGTSTFQFELRINGSAVITASGVNDTAFFANNVTTASVAAGNLVSLRASRTAGVDDINGGFDFVVGFTSS